MRKVNGRHTADDGRWMPSDGKSSRCKVYVIKFVSDLPQVGGFLWVLWLPPDRYDTNV
jgi:hypothetical protein